MLFAEILYWKDNLHEITKEPVYMKCQSLFSGKKNKKKYFKCHLLKFLPSMRSINLPKSIK